MTNQLGLGLRFRLGAIAILSIALPALAQQDQMAPPRLSLSSPLEIPLPKLAIPAQSSQPAQASQGDKDKPKKPKTNDEKAETATPATSNDRLFFALPNFLSVESADKIPPLTTKQKFAVVTRSSFD
ncbi:MAG TPA: hypothetical protein VII37_08615 [Candidatus Acidoferrum sp.]